VALALEDSRAAWRFARLSSLMQGIRSGSAHLRPGCPRRPPASSPAPLAKMETPPRTAAWALNFMKTHSSVRQTTNRKVTERGGRSGSGSAASYANALQQSDIADSFLSKRVLLACLILVAGCIFVYSPVAHYGFLGWDDRQYIGNAKVSNGLTWEGFRWAMTSTYASNWHPVTWLSHMLDAELYGGDAGPQHITNLILHILNSLLLLGLLYRMTGALGRSTFAAGLFAVHPLHVESVAWIAERKDVLSTFFFLLAIWAYLRYVKRPVWQRYLWILMLFGLALMAKPMAVTFPFVLLLLDFWPLRRVEIDRVNRRITQLPRLLKEKLPLFALAAADCLITLTAQQRGGAVLGIEQVSLSFRFANALASYFGYIAKTLWPARLGAYYPIGTSAPVVQAILGSLLLIVVTVLAVRAGQRRGYFLVGWLWYVGTLIPVIGFVQVGDQSMADRYTYIPLIGIFVIVAWGILPELLARSSQPGKAFLAIAGCVLLACAITARGQVRYWSDDVTLWRRALEVGADNPLARKNLGAALMHQGKNKEAIPQLIEALRMDRNDRLTNVDLGMALMAEKRFDEAIPHFLKVLLNKPDAEAQYGLGACLMQQGKLDEAIPHFVDALRLKPEMAEARYCLGMVLMKQNRPGEAVPQLTEALRIKPGFAPARDMLKAALAMQGNNGR
jgi:tetratricopeptide (TPR) repeat protein